MLIVSWTGTFVNNDVTSYETSIADHRYSAIGRHLRDAHGNIDLLNDSQFRMLKKCSTKWDCLVYEMLYIRTIRPNLNTQSDSIRSKLIV